ncbi:MAG: hypothetical protein NVSMB26_19680 [Beijerinckiaceae bacterium]
MPVDIVITSPGDVSNSVQRSVSGIVHRDSSDKRIVYIHLQDQAGGAFYAMGDVAPNADGSWGAGVTLGGMTRNPTSGTGFTPGIEGPHSITAELRVAYDNTVLATSAPVVYTLLRTPPTLTFSPLPAGTVNATLSVSGTIDAPHYRLPISIADNGVPLKQVSAGADGRWNTSVTLSGVGTHSLYAAATDQAGNRGQSPPVVTMFSPTVPRLAVSSVSLADAPGGIFHVTGTIDAADRSQPISIYDGATEIVAVPRANVTEDGHWNVDVRLAPGTHSLTAKATNAAGTGVSAPVTAQGAAAR